MQSRRRRPSVITQCLRGVRVAQFKAKKKSYMLVRLFGLIVVSFLWGYIMDIRYEVITNLWYCGVFFCSAWVLFYKLTFWLLSNVVEFALFGSARVLRWWWSKVKSCEAVDWIITIPTHEGFSLNNNDDWVTLCGFQWHVRWHAIQS